MDLQRKAIRQTEALQRTATADMADLQRQALADTQRKHDDEVHTKHAISCIERAFEVISNTEHLNEPSNDRLAWLACARLLLAAEDAAGLISPRSSGLKKLFNGEKEYWRMRFYDFFQIGNLEDTPLNYDFFAESRLGAGDAIDEKSIRAIFDFINLPNDWNDPLDRVARYSWQEVQTMPLTMSGVRQYVGQNHRFRDQRSGE